ncbi:MAG: Tad domain-containing protein, partial [Candidatus Firestonebacteria bacterium]
MKKTKGQTAVLLLIFLPFIFLILAYTLSNGKLIYRRIKLQNATDGAAYTAALWQARGLNIISDLNWCLLTAFTAESARLNFAYPITRSVAQAQDMVNRTFPGTAAFAGYGNFKNNFKNGIAAPLNMTGMFSLKVKRIGPFPELQYMVKDTEAGWVDQKNRGPYVLINGIGKAEPGFIGTNAFGFGIPLMDAVAQAMPAKEDSDLRKVLNDYDITLVT